MSRSTLAVCCELLPTVTVPKLSVEGASETPGAEPVPLRLTTCVPTLSPRMRVPVRVPVVLGMNVTWNWQLFPAAAAAGSVPQFELLTAKSPLVENELRVRALVPLFVSVTVCAALVVPIVWLPYVTLEAERLTPATVPVPLVAMTWVPALSTMVIVPVRAPFADGVNVIEMVQ